MQQELSQTEPAGRPWLLSPLWPTSKLDRTTPLNLLATAACVVVGIVWYAKGHTYEGSMLAYMIASIVFAMPYFLRRYTHWTPVLIMITILPQLLWAQNKGVEVGNWKYREGAEYVLGKITQQGEGPFGWTRLIWFGNTMPTVEYIFYPSMGIFQMTVFTLYASLIPKRHMKARKWLGTAFYVFYTTFTLVFLSLFFIYSSNEVMDFNWWVMCVGISTTWAGLAVSRSFRRFVQTPAMWLWLLGMAGVFLPLWEIFHCCVNHDWVYITRRTMPAIYTINGAPITLVEPFGYVALAGAFPAHLSIFIDHLKRTIVRDERLVFTAQIDGPPAQPNTLAAAS
jgi:hypothetical protein